MDKLQASCSRGTVASKDDKAYLLLCGLFQSPQMIQQECSKMRSRLIASGSRRSGRPSPSSACRYKMHSWKPLQDSERFLVLLLDTCLPLRQRNPALSSSRMLNHKVLHRHTPLRRLRSQPRALELSEEEAGGYTNLHHGEMSTKTYSRASTERPPSCSCRLRGGR